MSGAARSRGSAFSEADALEVSYRLVEPVVVLTSLILGLIATSSWIGSRIENNVLPGALSKVTVP